MIPKIVTSSELRGDLAHYLRLSTDQVVVIKVQGDDVNKVMIDENEYNRLKALADQFEEEDPEGKYRPEFVKDILERSQHPDVDTSVSSLSELS